MMKKQMRLMGMVLLGAAVASVAQESGMPEREDFGNLTLDNLPHVQVLIQQAIDAGVSIDGSLESQRRRIRNSAYLPTFKVQGRMTQRYYTGYNHVDVSKVRSDNNTDTGTAYFDSGDHGQGWGAQGAENEEWTPEVLVYAQWDLDKLFFHTDELNMTRRHIFAAKGRSMVIKRVRGLYSALEGLLEEKGDDELDDTDPLAIEIDIAATQLDFFTGHYLSDILDQQSAIVVQAVNEEAEGKAPAVAEPIEEPKMTETAADSVPVKADATEKKSVSEEDTSEMVDFLQSL